MTGGLRFVMCLQEAGWNQARRIQQALFLPSASTFWEIILQSTRRAFWKLTELFPCNFQQFSTRVEISIRPLDLGWDSWPCCHVNAGLLLCGSRVEIRQINIAWVIGWLTKQCARTYYDTGDRFYRHLLFDVRVYFDRMDGLCCILRLRTDMRQSLNSFLLLGQMWTKPRM